MPVGSESNRRIEVDLQRQRQRLLELVKRRMGEDILGYYQALVDCELVRYLERDLEGTGIHLSLVLEYERQFRAKFTHTDIMLIKASIMVVNTINSLSLALDGSFYEPLYRRYLPKNYLGVAELLALNNSHNTIIPVLRTIKVVCSTLSVYNGGLAIGAYAMGQLPRGAFHCVVCYDLFMVSFNCYGYRYYSLYIDMITSNASTVGETIYSFISTVIGATHKVQNPLVKLYAEIQWNLLWEGTITKNCITQVCK